MGLKVTRQTDLTGLFDKFASIPADKTALKNDIDKEATELKKKAEKEQKK